MKRPRVYATCNIGEEALQRLVALGYELDVHDGFDPPPKSVLLEKVGSGVDALIVTLRDHVDEEILLAGRGTLKVIAQDAVGVDNIDREAANRCRIPFTHTPDVLTDATAEFALFMMGCLARKLYASERFVRKKQWKRWHPFLPFLGDEVSGKTVAVIGAGRIGKAFALKCAGLDMDILCHSRSGEDRLFVGSVQRLFALKSELGLTSRSPSVRYVSLEEGLRAADYVSLHVPLSPETRHLIGESTLGLMKRSAYLINTSRGAVVDERALHAALRARRIAGAALDVFETEPLPDDSPLRDPDLEDRLRLFHHAASTGRRTRLSPDPAVGMAGRCVQGVIDVLEGNYGGNPAAMPFVVNKEAFQS